MARNKAVEYPPYESCSHGSQFMVREERQAYTVDQDSTIIKELLAFRRLKRNTLGYLVCDDSMAPIYKPGDYVAGTRRTGVKISDLLHSACIVQTSDDQILLRYLLNGTHPGFYHLTCINPGTSVSVYTLYDQELIYAAPVIWHRRYHSY